MIWGADPSTPHDQYILELGAPLIRYRPYKYRSRQEMAQHIQDNPGALGGLIICIPNYHIILVVEEFDEHTDTWEYMSSANPLNEQIVATSSEATTFYITHKIQPNAAKFDRYRIN